MAHNKFQNVGVVEYSIEVYLEHEGKRVVQAVQPIKVLSVLPSPPPPPRKESFNISNSKP